MKIKPNRFEGNLCYNLAADEWDFDAIYTRLIYLTARLTEYRACGIYHEMKEIEKQIDKKRPFDRIICFHNYGVQSFSTEVVENTKDSNVRSAIKSAIETWELIYNPHFVSDAGVHGRLTLSLVIIR